MLVSLALSDTLGAVTLNVGCTTCNSKFKVNIRTGAGRKF
jgi:hypothetical protein